MLYSRARTGWTVLWLLVFALRLGGATFSAQGTNLTVTSSNLRVTFSGADVVGIANLLTNENYVRNPSSNMQLNLTLLQGTSQVLAASGSWTVNSGGTSASLSFTDSNRTVSVTVGVDPTTQQIVVDLTGTAQIGGVEQLMWGVTGFDMTLGRFIVPAVGGVSLNGASFAAQSTFDFSITQGNAHWEAPLSLFQSSLGGVAIFSTDTQSLFKDLSLSANQQQTVNELFEVEAAGPWGSATMAGPIEWRMAAYQGDWQAGARIYRDWHNVAIPPVPLTGPRAWANNIKTVVKLGGQPPFTASVIDPLAQVLDPTKTLIYIFAWADFVTNGANLFPDYTPASGVQALVAHAQQLGFHVMLHTDMVGVSPLESSDYAMVQQYQTTDPHYLQPQGWYWSLPASTVGRYAWIDPASSAYRNLYLSRITPAIQAVSPDAIHLDVGWPINDGNGLLGGINYSQGQAQLLQQLLTAFPGLVIGTEGTTDTIAPYATFVQWNQWPTPFTADLTPPVPISAYILPNLRPYGHLGMPDPDQGGFLDWFTQYEGQNTLPTFWFNQYPNNFTQADWVRYLKLVSAVQTDNLQPAWDTNWNDSVMRYSGTNGTSATVTDNGTLVSFNVQQSGNSTLLYQRVHESNQINSTFSVPGWPAYNGTLSLGLDPAYQFWLDGSASSSRLPYIDGMPFGARLGLGTGTLATSLFSYFQVLPPSSAPFDFFLNLWLANEGVAYNGADFPLANGAIAGLTYSTVGGITREAVFTSPPYTAQRGGETFFEYTIPLPVGGSASVSFAAGIIDQAIGSRQGPMTFKVEVNGMVLWQKDVSTGAWQPGSIDLSSFLGQTIKIRFVSDPGPSGNPNFGWGAWSAMQLVVAANNALNGITLSVPSGVTSSNVAVTSGSAVVSNGAVTVSGLAPGGTVFVFNGQPTAVSASQSLLNLPFTASQSGTGELAGPSQVPFVGIIASSTSGGVTKPQTLWAPSPNDGQTILTWYLQLPPSPGLGLSFSASYWDGSAPFPQGYLLSARVNGVTLWQSTFTSPSGWQYGVVNLSPWSGQTIALDLITDSQGQNNSPTLSWAELNFSSAVTTAPHLSINSGHTGNFTQGQSNATYTLTVSNAAGVGTASGVVTVTETLPAGLPLVSMAGTGWTCSSNSCTRSDGLNAGANYPAITVTVNVAGDATSPQLNSVSVSGGGSDPATVTDPTAITAVPQLSIAKMHTGNFSLGQLGATYTVTVSNAIGAASTGGTVTMTETVPTGMTLVSMAGTGWTCPGGGTTCTRSDPLSGGVGYPAITVSVNVATNAISPLVNNVSVSGGGMAGTSSASDLAVIIALPQLSIAKSHTGNFSQGQTGAIYTVTASNATSAGATSGTVTVTETMPPGLTLVSMSGTGWTCLSGTTTCTRSDPLAAGVSYQAITVTVNVSPTAPSSLTNSVSVSGGGSSNASATDPTTIVQLSDLTVTKTHTGNFTQGQSGAIYTITVTNSGVGPTSGTVTVTDTMPTGLTATAMAGTGWSCNVGTVTCTRSDAVGAGISYPAIALTVNVAANAPASVTNTVTVSGGGEINTSNDTASSPTTIVPLTVISSVTSSTTNGAYTAGQSISIQAVFSKIVNVTGTPKLALNSGGTASYSSGSGTSTLTFTYLVGATDSSAHLDYTSTGALSLNGGTINDVALNPAVLTLAAPGTAGSLGSNTSFVVTSSASTALRFVAVTPCRVVDTRLATGPFGGPGLFGNSRDFALPNGACGVPSTAKAYALNVTVVPGGPLGYLTIWPTGQPQPTVSTLNSLDGRIKANAAIVPAGSGGAITVYASAATDVVLDINGYFTSDVAQLAFYPVTPCRVADTRNAPGTFGGPTMPAAATRNFPVPSSICNIPSTAAAYSLNFTVVPPGPLGYLTAWPTGGAQPVVSTLNAPTGVITANAAIVPAGTGSAISLYVSATTDVVIDINGYFAPNTGSGLSFYTATPCRAMDTRLATGPLGGPTLAGQRDFPLATSACGLPSTAQAYSLNATVVPQTTLGYLTLWPKGQTQPVVSTLNSPDGSIVANAAIVPAVSGSISAFASNTADLILDANGYFGP